jgi:hypothetical protein
LYEVVTAALVQHKHTDFTDAVTVVIDVVEPLIRRDQMQKDWDDHDGDPSVGWHMEYQEDAILRLVQEKADLRAEVQAMHAEAGQALLHSVTRDEVTAASTGISVLEDVLRVIDGISDE